MLVNPKLSGIFDYFNNLDDLSIENIARWLPFKIETHAIENFVANRILYPQTVPATEQEMEIDLSILREAVRINSRLFYNHSRSSIVIPSEFEARFPPLIKLISALADVLVLNGVTKIFVKSWVGSRLMGSIVTPPLTQQKESILITLSGKKYNLVPNSFTRFPVLSRHEDLAVDNSLFDASGGRFGIFVDLRGSKLSNK